MQSEEQALLLSTNSSLLAQDHQIQEVAAKLP